MEPLTTIETEWVKAAGKALVAIRDTTRSRPDDDQLRDIRFLADAFHNIGMVSGENQMFAFMHTPERLAKAQEATKRLFDQAHKLVPSPKPPPKPSVLAKIFGRQSR